MSTVNLTVSVDFWGPYACFTNPLTKAERRSYDVPTPSAARGMLDSIYVKPEEFYWSVRKIEVLRPIRRISCKRNEVKVKTTGVRPIDVEQAHTPRTSVLLKDVKYRVTAAIVPKYDDLAFAMQLYEQMVRRLRSGQCFKQPYLGMREFAAMFAPSDFREKPILDNRDFGPMLFDTHIPGNCTKGFSGADISVYHCVMRHGVIIVPPYDSLDVAKTGRLEHV